MHEFLSNPENNKIYHIVPIVHKQKTPISFFRTFVTLSPLNSPIATFYNHENLAKSAECRGLVFPCTE